MSDSLTNQTIFITGATRGIGRAMALRLAKAGARIVVTGKTVDDNDTSFGGSIHSVAQEIEQLGSEALAIALDVRDEQALQTAIDQAYQHWNRLDGVICNAGALDMSPALDMSMKKFDLVHQVNGRATFATLQAAAPYLQKAHNPHALVMAPPINLNSHWFKQGLGYTMSKYSMSLCVLGFQEELAASGVAVNALWPKTLIATAAIKHHFPKLYPLCRQPDIVAEAAYYILTSPSSASQGQFLTDEAVLAEQGVTDLSHYAVDPSQRPYPDFYIDH